MFCVCQHLENTALNSAWSGYHDTFQDSVSNRVELTAQGNKRVVRWWFVLEKFGDKQYLCRLCRTTLALHIISNMDTCIPHSI